MPPLAPSAVESLPRFRMALIFVAGMVRTIVGQLFDLNESEQIASREKAGKRAEKALDLETTRLNIRAPVRRRQSREWNPEGVHWQPSYRAASRIGGALTTRVGGKRIMTIQSRS